MGSVHHGLCGCDSELCECAMDRLKGLITLLTDVFGAECVQRAVDEAFREMNGKACEHPSKNVHLGNWGYKCHLCGAEVLPVWRSKK